MVQLWVTYVPSNAMRFRSAEFASANIHVERCAEDEIFFKKTFQKVKNSFVPPSLRKYFRKDKTVLKRPIYEFGS